jgi:signal peptide peptidase SppA
MEEQIWLGSEASHQVVMKYLTEFTHTNFNKEAFFPSPFDDEPTTDPVFGVSSDRVGLSVLRKLGEQTVIQVHGSLVPNFSRWHVWFRGSAVSYEAIRDALAICEEAGIKDVIMHFDTNGGSVRGMSQTSDAMKRYQRTGGKLRGHTDALAASAGYWLLCGCDTVTASEMAEIGSIGTMAVITTLVNTEATRGVKFTVIKAGKYKALGNPYEELTDEVKKRLQQNIDETNDFFLKRVSVARNLMISDTGIWAEGQVFFAEKARQVGLIDKVTTMDDLIGSGPAANNPSDTRRFEMEISAEKLAQIQAGADPKDVLTEAELKLYMANLSEAKTDPVDDPVAKAAATQTEAEAAAAAEAEKKAAAPAAAVSMSDELKKSLRENGVLETKLEMSLAEVAQLKEANETLTKSMDSLLVVAQASVTNLQKAMGKPLEIKNSVAEVLAQYNELQGQMAKVFKTGQQSQATSVQDTTVKSDTLDYRLSMTQPSKTGR